jgi:hypothetical protein
MPSGRTDPWSVVGAGSRWRGHPRHRLVSGLRGLNGSLVVTVVFLLAGTGMAEAQGGPPLQVQGRQDLTFGDLLGGLPRHIPPTDPANAAQFRIQGRGNTEMILSFILPTGLTGPGGASLPLSFGPIDGGLSYSGNVTDQLPFDPRSPLLIVLPPGGGAQRAHIFLGGTATPPGQAPLGAYSGSIVLTLATVTN